MPEHLTEAEIAEAKRLLSVPFPEGSKATGEWLLRVWDLLPRALAELEALRAKYKIALAALSSPEALVSTTQLSVPSAQADTPQEAQTWVKE